jgi:hypothetical protein
MTAPHDVTMDHAYSNDLETYTSINSNSNSNIVQELRDELKRCRIIMADHTVYCL